MKTSCIQGQLLPSARAEAERRVEAATEVTGNSGLDQRISRGLGGGGARGLLGVQRSGTWTFGGAELYL